MRAASAGDRRGRRPRCRGRRARLGVRPAPSSRSRRCNRGIAPSVRYRVSDCSADRPLTCGLVHGPFWTLLADAQGTGYRASTPWRSYSVRPMVFVALCGTVTTRSWVPQPAYHRTRYCPWAPV